MSSSKIRVLTFINSLEFTGAPKVTLDALQAFQDAVETRFIAPRSGPLLDRCLALGAVDFLEYSPEKIWVKAARHLRRESVWDALNSSIEQWRPEVIYVNSVAALPLTTALRLPSVPVVLHVHELRSHLDLVAGNPSFQSLPRRYIAVAEAVEKSLIQNYQIPASKISRIYEFVPDDVFEAHSPASALPDKATIQQKPFVVGGAGTISLRKGVTLWLQMAKALKQDLGPGRVRFVWVGVSTNHEGILFRQLAQHLGLEDDIEFVPITPDPLSYFQTFDVFASTALEDPCPIVVLENMMLEVPVACFTDSGGAPEEVGETGLVIPDFDPGKMASAIADLLNAPERRAAMGKAARERVRSHFRASVQAPKLLDELRAASGRAE